MDTLGEAGGVRRLVFDGLAEEEETEVELRLSGLGVVLLCSAEELDRSLDGLRVLNAQAESRAGLG
jgi:hypothetical protein